MKIYKPFIGKLGVLIAIFGVFAFVEAVSASTAETLQPASVQIIKDELQVLGTARAYSVRIGSQGSGGVTFFNGTIINETTNVDTGAEQPVTFGDDVRIDGRIWRGENAGPGLNDDRELIVNDDMEITGDLTVGGLVGTGIVDSDNILNATIATADLADNAITSAKIANGTIATTNLADDAITSAKIANGTIATTNLADDAITSAKIINGTITGSDISSSADLNVDTITATGDITQDLEDHGAVKAMIYVPADGDCTSSNGRQWTYNGSTITCNRTVAGEGIIYYKVTFNFNINNRFWQVTPAPNPITGDDLSTEATAYMDPFGNSKQIWVSLFHDSEGADTYSTSSFMLTIY